MDDACGVCNGENECFDCGGKPNGGAFINACGDCECGIDGQVLGNILDACTDMPEMSIYVDYDGKVMNFSYKNLTFKVPHEKIIYRNFVLFPLQEIVPNWIHPETKDSIDVLINKLSNEDKKSILKVKKS